MGSHSPRDVHSCVQFAVYRSWLDSYNARGRREDTDSCFQASLIGGLDPMESGTEPAIADEQVPGTSVGRVQGLQDSTPLLWHVAVQDGAYLQLDDVVVTVRDVPGQGAVTTSGVVTEVCARHEGASFGSDVFLIADGVLPAAVQEVAEVATTRVDPELYVPPRPGETVRRATGT